MELERRVKTLEQEMKILKNQIQTTLREIQEQILIHYYPSLRSDSYVEKTKEESRPAEFEGDPDNGSFASKPKVKMVSLDEIRQRKAQVVQPSETENGNGRTEQTIGNDMAELARWMGENVIELGAEKTGRMIEMKVEDGSISPAAKDKLFQLLGMFDDGDLDEGLVREMVDTFLRLNKLSG
ncbi:MAG: hypothetical protein H6667_11080 [Ardenticatenaceae bacterium]|nr:hypothetical protein [Ardenticatenaceae bacterium]MCB9444353.1 hypothetical protein [Ardenticatenaceae bacterium]